MIKLLLVTWNVEGYEQLDIDETEPQLAYVAFWMMQKGQQTITYNDLKSCLNAARRQMPDILDYTKISVSEFIKRVESRSSLLIMSGHQRTQDGTVPIYEFLHLSFQEYLAAKSIAERYLPETENEKSFIDIIEPYITEQNWKEVIPLLAVLLKRQSKALIDYLTNKVKSIAIDRATYDATYNDDIEIDDDDNDEIIDDDEIDDDEIDDENISKAQDAESRNKIHIIKSKIPRLLGNCLANEIQITPDALDSAFEWYVKSIDCDQETETIDIILNSKFSDLFRKKIINCFFEEFYNQYSVALADINAKVNVLNYKNLDDSSTLNSIIESVIKNEGSEKCLALLSLMQLSYNLRQNENISYLTIDSGKLYLEVVHILRNDDSYLSFATCWSLVWIYANAFFKLNEDQHKILVNLLIKKWLSTEVYDTSRFAAWILTEIMSPTTNISFLGDEINKVEELVKDRFHNPRNNFEKYAALYVGINISAKLHIEHVHEALLNCDNEISNRHKRDIAYANFLDLDIQSEDSEMEYSFQEDLPM